MEVGLFIFGPLNELLVKYNYVKFIGYSLAWSTQMAFKLVLKITAIPTSENLSRSNPEDYFIVFCLRIIVVCGPAFIYTWSRSNVNIPMIWCKTTFLFIEPNNKVLFELILWIEHENLYRVPHYRYINKLISVVQFLHHKLRYRGLLSAYCIAR